MQEKQGGSIITGQRFDKLTVIKSLGTDKSGHKIWLCRCDCGNEKIINSNNILYGHTKSCGCLRGKRPLFTKPEKHGLSNTKLYGVWSGMLTRCYNSNSRQYKYYGGRGITICQEWIKSFLCFYDWALSHGYQEGLEIDRINNDGNYEPSNCRWATRLQQLNNRRTSTGTGKGIMIEINGELKSRSEWAEIYNINRGTIKERIRTGWNPVDAVITPIGKKPNK